MIYFSTNSDYHFDLAEKIINSLNLSKGKVIFIVQTALRNTKVANSQYQKVLLPGFPPMRMRKPAQLLIAFKHKQYIENAVDFKKNDIFIFFTEYELNNHCFAKKMKMAVGKVYLFDEGIGFYVGNSPYHTPDKFTAKEKINRFRTDIPLKILRFPTYNKIDQEGFSLTLKDQYIDSIFSSLRLPLKRRAPMFYYRHFMHNQQSKLSKNNVLLATSSMKVFNLEREEFEFSEKILIHLLKKFKKVYLKIHPGDFASRTEAYYYFMKLIDKHPGTTLVDNKCLAEEAIEKYNIGIIVSPVCTALINAILMGCESIFFYHLLPDRRHFGVYNYTLKELGYNFIKDISEITPNYHSDLNSARLTYNKELSEYAQVLNCNNHESY